MTCFYPYRDTSVNLRLGDGTYAGIEISNISLVGDTISFSVNILTKKMLYILKILELHKLLVKK